MVVKERNRLDALGEITPKGIQGLRSRKATGHANNGDHSTILRDPVAAAGLGPFHASLRRRLLGLLIGQQLDEGVDGRILEEINQGEPGTENLGKTVVG